jgi:hypothetical protein
VLTPLPETDRRPPLDAAALWECAAVECGALDAAAHDRIFAAVSHLPHLLAFALVDAFAARSDAEDIFRFAASGFRDFTRIAGARRRCGATSRSPIAPRSASELPRSARSSIALPRWSKQATATRSPTCFARRATRAAMGSAVSGARRGASRWPAGHVIEFAHLRDAPRTHRLDLDSRRRAAQGVVAPAGSKSITNRTLLLAALARGATRVTDLLDADDVDRMREALVALGVA